MASSSSRGKAIANRVLSDIESLYTQTFLPPNLKLKSFTISKPNFYFIMAVLTFSAFCIFSGIFYDIINAPPSI